MLLAIVLCAAGCTSSWKMPSGFDDTVLESRVKEAFWVDPELSNAELMVTARTGVVELDGEVVSETIRARAGMVASKVEGVSQVINSIRVKKK
jgi:osmotically-inducible protein OsmY